MNVVDNSSIWLMKYQANQNQSGLSVNLQYLSNYNTLRDKNWKMFREAISTIALEKVLLAIDFVKD